MEQKQKRTEKCPVLSIEHETTQFQFEREIELHLYLCFSLSIEFVICRVWIGQGYTWICEFLATNLVTILFTQLGPLLVFIEFWKLYTYWRQTSEPLKLKLNRDQGLEINPIWDNLLHCITMRIWHWKSHWKVHPHVHWDTSKATLKILELLITMKFVS